MCLSVVVVSQHNRRIATKFGMHMRIDLGGILRGKNFKSGKCHELPRTSIIFVIPHLTPPVRGGGDLKPATGRPCIPAFLVSGTVPVFTCVCLRFYAAT